MDKTKFGGYIKAKRTEAGMTQKELADRLMIDVSAVSKWERGVTYPDITMIPDICTQLGVSEHELIESSNDTEYRAVRSDACRYRKIKNAIFYSFSIAYFVAVLTCFIVNIATEHSLSWFFIVAASCICGFTFVPTCIRFFSRYKLTVFVLTTYVSLVLLFVTCSLVTGSSWWHVAASGVLLGYFAVFFPILFSRQKLYMHECSYDKLKRFFLIMYAAGLALLTFVLLVSVNAFSPIDMAFALKTAGYCFTVLFAWTLVELLPVGRAAKLGIDSIVTGIYLFFMNWVLNSLFGTAEGCYRVDFGDWQNCSNGNNALISICVFTAVGIALLVISAVGRSRKKK